MECKELFLAASSRMHPQSEKFGFAPLSGARDNNEAAAFLWNVQAKVKVV